MRVYLRPDLEMQIKRMPGIRADIEKRAERVVERAQTAAPKLTGAGARSIHSEPLIDDNTGTFDGEAVSWDREHYYMLFAEVGTEHEPARPFLRPALEAGAGNSE